ncbi:ubiquitin-like protein [Lepidopterella palustris CBS 459.81]|uniref:Ubiquitin-like protein n=1 Tax=Lepidopterella palustris CBS 459.81 TaxID=1314670 RepID=A0A8E2JL17_9PEZI|nr:ubiquitin-like protein [Lepidopterella palustris CBS 459.81]
MSTIQSPSSELLREFTTSESTATTTSTTVPSPQHDTRPKSKSQSQPLVQPQSTSVASESVSRSAPSNPTAPTPAPALNRAESEAIGPSTDTPAIKPDTSNGPVVVITLLLTSGARHPYKIDEKYLKKRNVNVEAMDPFNISVYTLKELIWRDWREEWEPRPTSPSSIRLIHFGRMLDDKAPLTDCRFQVESPNVVHMTVKPQEVVDEEDAKTAKGGSRRDGDDESHAGCRCVIL